MAQYLLDTNLLLRLSDTASDQNRVASRAVACLFRRGDNVCITAQNLIEFWAVATRSREANGLGWTVERTLAKICDIRERFPLIPENPGIFEEWLRVVGASAITGKRVHDARLVAVMNITGIDHLLTFNGPDFSKIPGIHIIDPRTISSGLPNP